MYARTDFDFARAYYHWFHLIQPAPLPEQMIGGNPRNYLHAKLGGWGSGCLTSNLRRWPRMNARSVATRPSTPPARTTAPAQASTWTTTARGRARRQNSLRHPGAVGAHGVVNRLFDPLALWQAQCSASVTGWAMPAGHFIPEQLPEETAAALKAFC